MQHFRWMRGRTWLGFHFLRWNSDRGLRKVNILTSSVSLLIDIDILRNHFTGKKKKINHKHLWNIVYKIWNNVQYISCNSSINYPVINFDVDSKKNEGATRIMKIVSSNNLVIIASETWLDRRRKIIFNDQRC